MCSQFIVNSSYERTVQNPGYHATYIFLLVPNHIPETKMTFVSGFFNAALDQTGLTQCQA